MFLCACLPGSSAAVCQIQGDTVRALCRLEADGRPGATGSKPENQAFTLAGYCKLSSSGHWLFSREKKGSLQNMSPLSLQRIVVLKKLIIGPKQQDLIIIITSSFVFSFFRYSSLSCLVYSFLWFAIIIWLFEAVITNFIFGITFSFGRLYVLPITNLRS